MNQPKVSVIIPVYKAEAFIERCARSLFEQTLDDMEYIFVNDCTPDKSIEIVKNVLGEYPHRQKQVHIINHQENQGVAKSREDGINKASGEYIIHCDSDDYVDLDMYEVMYLEGKEKNAEVVCCNYYAEYRTHKVLNKFPYKEETKQNMILGISPIYGSLCNKLVKKSLFDENDLKFYEDINMGEDLGLATRFRFFSKKTIIVPKAFYHYTVQNNNSIFTNFTLEKNNDIIKCSSYLEKFFIKHNAVDQFHFQIEYLKFQSKQYLLINKNIRDLNKWLSIFPETHSYIWEFKDSPFNIRLIAWLVSKKMNLMAKILLSLKDKYRKY